MAEKGREWQRMAENGRETCNVRQTNMGLAPNKRCAPSQCVHSLARYLSDTMRVPECLELALSRLHQLPPQKCTVGCIVLTDFLNIRYWLTASSPTQSFSFWQFLQAACRLDIPHTPWNSILKTMTWSSALS